MAKRDKSPSSSLLAGPGAAGPSGSYGSFVEPALDGDAPPRHASWPTASLLIICDIIGIGVMGVATSFAQLGWALSIPIVTLLLPLNIYMGYITWEANMTFPSAVSFGQLARLTYGKEMEWFTALLVYSCLVLLLGEYVLGLGLCLEQGFYMYSAGRPFWSMLGMLVMLPFVQIRTLDTSRWLLYLNVLTIVVALGASLGYIIYEGQDTMLQRIGDGPTESVASSLGWVSLSLAIGKFAFIYAGLLMYPEIISEMKEPEAFPKAQLASAPAQLVAFMLVGCIGYAYLGRGASGMLISALPNGPTSQAMAFALFVHLVITYLVKSVVVTRALHNVVSPSTVNDFEPWGRGTLVWFALSCLILVWCYGIATAVPFFDDLTSLIGTLQLSIVTFCLPVLFAEKARSHRGEPASRPLQLAHATIFAFGVVLSVVGTAACAVDIRDQWRAQGKVR